MAEETAQKDLATEKLLPEKKVEPVEASPAAAEAIKKAPEAVRRSMPMGLSIALGILIAGLVGWLFHYLTWFILVLYLSFIAATILEAPVHWLKTHGIRRGFAAVIVMLGGLTIVLGVMYFVTMGVYGQVAQARSDLAKAPERINRFVNSVRHHFVSAPRVGPATRAGGGAALANDTAASAPAASAPATAVASAPSTEPRPGDVDVFSALASSLSFSSIWSNAMSGVEAISWIVIMFFIVLYMLIDGADHLKGTRRLIPKRHRLEATRLFNEIAKAHRGWALASASNVISATLLTSLGLWITGIPGALLLGFVAGLGELIPNIGPFLGAMPALLFTLLAEPDRFVYVVCMFVVVQTIQSYTISPLMLKFSVELPVLATIISVLVFGTLFGFLGVLVAIPLVADLVVLWDYLNRYMEKDTDDYDAVNAPVGHQREPMSPDNTPASRLRKMFRRQARADAKEPVRGADGNTGLDRLANAERASAAGKGT